MISRQGKSSLEKRRWGKKAIN